MLEKVLALDMEHLTQEERDWLHHLKNLATTMQARIQLKHLKEEGKEL